MEQCTAKFAFRGHIHDRQLVKDEVDGTGECVVSSRTEPLLISSKVAQPLGSVGRGVCGNPYTILPLLWDTMCDAHST